MCCAIQPSRTEHLEHYIESIGGSNLCLSGEGAYAQVYRFVVGKRFYAVKWLHAELSERSNPKRKMAIATIEKEKTVLRELRGTPHVPELQLLWKIPGEDEHSYFMTALAAPPLKAMRSSLKKGQILSILMQMLEPLIKLHSLGKIHADITPANLLYSESGNRALLVDFGAATEWAKIDSESFYVTTRWYRAPEVACGLPSIDATSDIWSLAVTLIGSFSREHLFPVTSLTTENGQNEYCSMLEFRCGRENFLEWLQTSQIIVEKRYLLPVQSKRSWQQLLGEDATLIRIFEPMMRLSKRATAEQMQWHLQDLYAEHLLAHRIDGVLTCTHVPKEGKAEIYDNPS